MIVTVTANAAIDRTLRVEALRRGTRQTVLEDRAQAGGKGLNVARVARALGEAVHAIVVIGGDAGRWILADLERDGIPATPVWASGESRTCLEILEARGAPTRLHGPGVTAETSTRDALEAAVVARASGARWVALCGRLARGLPADTYARLVERARPSGAGVAVDTSAPALAPAWGQGPDLLRVNRDELDETLGPVGLPPERAPASVRLAVVSHGSGPVIAWTDAAQSWRAIPPAVDAVNPIGCGDAMLAGLLHTLREPWDPEAALRSATALASAEAEAPAAGLANPRRARELESSVGIERLEGPRARDV